MRQRSCRLFERACFLRVAGVCHAARKGGSRATALHGAGQNDPCPSSGRPADFASSDSSTSDATQKAGASSYSESRGEGDAASRLKQRRGHGFRQDGLHVLGINSNTGLLKGPCIVCRALLATAFDSLLRKHQGRPTGWLKYPGPSIARQSGIAGWPTNRWSGAFYRAGNCDLN